MLSKQRYLKITSQQPLQVFRKTYARLFNCARFWRSVEAQNIYESSKLPSPISCNAVAADVFLQHVVAGIKRARAESTSASCGLSFAGGGVPGDANAG